MPKLLAKINFVKLILSVDFLVTYDTISKSWDKYKKGHIDISVK